MNEEQKNNLNELNDNYWTKNSIDIFEDNNMIDIDAIIKLQVQSEQNDNENIWNSNTTSVSATSDEINKNKSSFSIKNLAIWLWIFLLITSTVIGIYIMYPVEISEMGTKLQGNVFWNGWSWDNNNSSTGNDVIISSNNNANNETNSWVKNNVDDLFGLGNAEIDNNTDNTNEVPPKDVDDLEKLSTNPDGSSGVNDDSILLEWLSSGGSYNYGNWDTTTKNELLWQIKAKLEVAKINYQDAKNVWNKDAMKIIIKSISEYNTLQSDVENNNIVITSEIKDKLVEIQSEIDQAKIMIQ